MFLFLFEIYDAKTDENETDWSFLTTTTIGAKQFIQSHPDYNGRGIVIFILDSGVDMAVPGLTQTSDGRMKVIDVRDFSGQGDVLLFAGEVGADGQENYIQHPDGFKLYNYQHLANKPVDGQYMIGYLDENQFINSAVKDINNNGKYDDLFGILVFEVENGDSLYWVAYVDTDADQQIDDEKEIRDYHVKYDHFQLRGGDKRYDRRPLTFALNIDPHDMQVSFHFDDDGHGTHVAGIAAGYKINAQEGLNGIAPGAQIISLKIGNGIYEGGCTVTGSLRKALNFVEDYVHENKQPVVVNISYGIGSVREGQSDIDNIVKHVLQYNKNIFICVSNGNEGPGFSSTGTPAAAASAFSVGALLPTNVANDYYGANLKTDKIFYFSARGGELNKPDALAPGLASSTIPAFTDNDFMRGTSMAAPQASGAAALLLSAAIQSSPKLLTNNILLHRTLKFSAQPIDGYSYLDQGNGVIKVPNAYEYLKYYSGKFRGQKVYEYEVRTECPIMKYGFAPSAYWRTGGFFPNSNETQTFTVQPIFGDSVDADTRANFYRAFDLKSSHRWLELKNKSVYMKGENPAKIEVKYNSGLMTAPGLYCGKIFAFRKQQGITKYDPKSLEFELQNTIIIPHVFDLSNKYRQEFMSQKIEPGDVERYFILVPVGATSAKIVLSQVDQKFCNVNCFGFTPNGTNYFTSQPVTSKNKEKWIQIIPAKDLSPGIWEIDVYADFQNEKPSLYNLSISFSSFHVEPPAISDFNYEIGDQPKGNLKITNQFNAIFYGFGRGKLNGYQRTQRKVISDRDRFTYDFRVDSDIDRVEFEVNFEDDSFVQFSDVAINVLDVRGSAIFKDAMNHEASRIDLDRISEGSYTLEIIPAFAYSAYEAVWKFNLTERYFTRENVDIKLYQGVDRLFKLYPFIKKEFEFILSNSPTIPPDGFNIFGTIEFIDRDLLQQVFTVPVEFKKKD